MPKTLVEFRAQNLRLLERLCPDDPRYIQAWLKQFDEQNGITPKHVQSPAKREGLLRRGRLLRPVGPGQRPPPRSRHADRRNDERACFVAACSPS